MRYKIIHFNFKLKKSNDTVLKVSQVMMPDINVQNFTFLKRKMSTSAKIKTASGVEIGYMLIKKTL